MNQIGSNQNIINQLRRNIEILKTEKEDILRQVNFSLN